MGWPDFQGQVALVTGGTRGLGLACGLALGGRGAQVVLTSKWGSASEAAILGQFSAAGAPPPLLLNGDAAVEEDTRQVVAEIAERFGRLDFFINGVCVTSRGGSLESLRKRDIAQSLRYSSWPILSYLEAMRARFGAVPSKIISLSSDGPDHHYPGYDYVALAKAALEAITRKLACDLRGEARVFILRARQVSTESFGAVFPLASQEILAQAFATFEISPGAVGNAAAALCSGYLDGLNGTTLCIDKGATFYDNVLSAGPQLLESLAHAR